jgi:hypothetical protein
LLHPPDSSFFSFKNVSRAGKGAKRDVVPADEPGPYRFDNPRERSPSLPPPRPPRSPSPRRAPSPKRTHSPPSLSLDEWAVVNTAVDVETVAALRRLKWRPGLLLSIMTPAQWEAAGIGAFALAEVELVEQQRRSARDG